MHNEQRKYSPEAVSEFFVHHIDAQAVLSHAAIAVLLHSTANSSRADEATMARSRITTFFKKLFRSKSQITTPAAESTQNGKLNDAPNETNAADVDNDASPAASKEPLNAEDRSPVHTAKPFGSLEPEKEDPADSMNKEDALAVSNNSQQPATTPATEEPKRPEPTYQGIDKQRLAAILYSEIQAHEPKYAAKITGMLLESMDDTELLALTTDDEALRATVKHARDVLISYLEMQNSAAHTGIEPDSPDPETVARQLRFDLPSPTSIRSWETISASPSSPYAARQASARKVRFRDGLDSIIASPASVPDSPYSYCKSNTSLVVGSPTSPNPEAQEFDPDDCAIQTGRELL